MALSFPNASRNYDAAKQSVSFWGYDSAFEVSFHVGREALQRISGRPCDDEAELLQAFDSNRPRIHQAATKAYVRRRGTYFSLAPADF